MAKISLIAKLPCAEGKNDEALVLYQKAVSLDAEQPYIHANMAQTLSALGRDEEAGELPKAYIVLNPAIPATVHEIMGFVAEHVATYKQIRIIEFINEIPKSASGKILRRVLRDMSAD